MGVVFKMFKSSVLLQYSVHFPRTRSQNFEEQLMKSLPNGVGGTTKFN